MYVYNYCLRMSVILVTTRAAARKRKRVEKFHRRYLHTSTDITLMHDGFSPCLSLMTWLVLWGSLPQYIPDAKTTSRAALPAARTRRVSQTSTHSHGTISSKLFPSTLAPNLRTSTPNGDELDLVKY